MQTRNPWADARHTFGASLRRRSLALASLTLLALSSAAVGPAALAHDGERDKRWVGSWSASPQPPAAPQQINDQTIREIVHLSIGGERVRVRLSNAFGTTSLVVGAAHVAQRSSGASIVPGSSRALRFNGATSTTIPPGAVMLSDPVALTVTPLAELAVSLYLPKESATSTHLFGEHNSYLSKDGDFSGSAEMTDATTSLAYYWLAQKSPEILVIAIVSGLVLMMGAIRLARFNVAPKDDRYFQGIPTTVVAGIIAATYLTSPNLPFGWAALLVGLLAVLMVSAFPYFKFSQVKRMPKWVPIIVIIAAIIDLPVTVLIVASAYIFSGPVLWWRLRQAA